MVGAGKTTYARQRYAAVTDLDEMHHLATKKQQIKLTKTMLKSNNVVCHITCFPTPEELGAFEDYEKAFIWIDTGLHQAKTNILIRNRERDLKKLPEVLKANRNYQKQLAASRLPFKKIKLFKS